MARQWSSVLFLLVLINSVLQAETKCPDITRLTTENTTGEWDDVNFPSQDSYCYHQFQYIKTKARGFWEKFETASDEGVATKYPKHATSSDTVKAGPYCVVNHKDGNIDELVASLGNRDFSLEDLVFLKIKSYVGDKLMEIRSVFDDCGMELNLCPYPFAIVRHNEEGKYKFLPIRLHQFKDLARLHSPTTLRAPDYSITGPWQMEIYLNITGDCWRDIRIFEEDGQEYISYMSDWAQKAIIAHLIDYLSHFTRKCKAEFGGMWGRKPYRDVCLVKNGEAARHSVPFVLVECCHYTYRSIDGTMDSYTLPIKCTNPQVSVKEIQTAIYIIAAIVFLFFLLAVRFIPSDAPAYIKLETNDEIPLCSMKRETNASNLKEQGKLLVGDEPQQENAEKGTNNIPLSDVTVGFSSNRSDDKQSGKPAKYKDKISIESELGSRVFLDSDPEFHLNVNLIMSYVTLCHFEYHSLILIRRIVGIFLSWLTVTVGLYYYGAYYHILLDDITEKLAIKGLIRLYTILDRELFTHTILSLEIPIISLIMAVLTFILLHPLLWPRQKMAKTLFQTGDQSFFGDPFPESLKQNKQIKRTHKPSSQRSVELLLYRNMVARLRNLGNKNFWKLWWKRFVYLDPHWMIPFRLLVALVMVILHSIPLFSMWSNFLAAMVRKIKLLLQNSASDSQESSRLSNKQEAGLRILQLASVCLGIGLVLFNLWLNLAIYCQFFIFLFIDILRNASETLPEIIVVISVLVYIERAFDSFEDSYRKLKIAVLHLCESHTDKMVGHKDEELEVVLKDPPYEPLYVKRQDGEVTIPRKVFYDVCDSYLPYSSHVVRTFTRLFFTFSTIIILFWLISYFQIMDEFTEVGDAFLTICTVLLPAMFGLLSSDPHKHLKNRRRDEHILLWVSKITTVRATETTKEEHATTRDTDSISSDNYNSSLV